MTASVKPQGPFRGSAGKRPAQSYKDFYNNETGVTKPDIQRTGAGVKPAVTKAPGNRPIPQKGRRGLDEDEKAEAIRRRLNKKFRKSTGKVKVPFKARS